MDKLNLDNGEEIILRAQGTIRLISKWQPGNLFLTNRRLIFMQAAKTLMECGLDKIIKISVEKSGWLMGVNIKQLRIEINYGNRIKYAYIAIDKSEEWVGTIEESMAIMLMERMGHNGAEQESSGDA